MLSFVHATPESSGRINDAEREYIQNALRKEYGEESDNQSRGSLGLPILKE